MKCLLLILLMPVFGMAQQSTKRQGNDSFSVWLTSSDTNKVKVYNIDTSRIYNLKDITENPRKYAIFWNDWVTVDMSGGKNLLSGSILYHDATMNAKDEMHIYKDGEPTLYNYVGPKYDTIGPMWRQVSDTSNGWNPVSSMRVYEVRVYKNEWITVDPNIYSTDKNGVETVTAMATHREERAIPRHYGWLNSKKQPLTLAVWSANIEK